MSKVLVIGASGFIGSALAIRLRAQGLNVVPVDYSVGDIADRGTLVDFEHLDIGHVFHLAGKTFVPDSWDDPHAFCKTNVLGTVNVMEFCKKKHIPVTYVSAYVYGHPYKLPIAEDSEISPSNPYALTKRLAEEVCQFYGITHQLPVSIIRPFNVFGIGQDKHFLIPAIIEQALGMGNEIIVKDLAPRRDYVYLEDLITALMATIGRTDGCGVYNIGSGASLSVQEAIEIIQDVAGTEKTIVSEQLIRNNEIMDVVADISKAEQKLAWKPEHSFRAGIEKIISSR